jgi:4-alpha-glucanotransferase
VTNDDLRAQARIAGIEVDWTDAHGAPRQVAPDVLVRVLDALGPLASAEKRPLVTADEGQPFILPGEPGRYRITHEDGSVLDGVADSHEHGQVRIGGTVPGYHRLQIGAREVTLAVAPPRCWTVMDATGGKRAWGLTAQLYALRRPGDGGIGDFPALGLLARSAAAAGATAIAISPAHAQFSADPGAFSPYTPSSRAMLNVLHAHPCGDGADVPDAILDWRSAAPARLAACRQAFATLSADTALAEEFSTFRQERGEALERHARFEALHAAQLAADLNKWDWHSWPDDLRSPDGAGIAAFAAGAADEVAFHAFMQFLADRGLAQAQRDAIGAGMKIGLIADIAIGVSTGGSDAWCRRREMLNGLTIGAPPDIYNPAGQDWGVTTYSPHGLMAHGYEAFLDMLRTAMRHAGGLRLDHAMGLARLWVVPSGSGPADGAYLRYPLDDLLRLVRLESWRHRAIVLGEDLGTLPYGFQGRLVDEGVAGMRVMWFERSGERFNPPGEWSPRAVAMTSTHDLPTVAGWWAGRDLDWRRSLNQQMQPNDDAERERDRAALWQAFTASGSAEGDMPDRDDAGRIADAAAGHLGTAACDLALLPLEDALALPEQPNFPNTVDEHPNWRRRLEPTVDHMLDTPDIAARLRLLARTRT